MHYAYTGNSGKTMDGAFRKPSRESSGHFFKATVSYGMIWITQNSGIAVQHIIFEWMCCLCCVETTQGTC